MSDLANSSSVRTVELAELPFAALLFRLLSNRFTGSATLQQCAPHAAARTIQFRGGMPVLTDWQLDATRFGELAVAQGVVSAAAVDRALALAKTKGIRVGDALRDVAELDSNRMLHVLRTQTLRRLVEVFSLESGLVTLAQSDGVDDELLQVNVLELVQRGVAACYDSTRVRREMGSAFAAPLHATAALTRYVEQFKFRPDDASLVGYLGTGATATAAELSRMPDVIPQRAAQVVYTLWVCRMIENVAAVPLVSTQQAVSDPEAFLAALGELEQRISSGNEPSAMLELDRDADTDAIHEAWSALSQRFDPAALPPEVEQSVRERVKIVAEALESVRDAARRRRHALAEIAGLRMVRDGKFARGLALLTEAKTLAPVGPEVEAAMIWAQLQTGGRTEADLKAADATFARIFGEHPDLVEILYYRACVASSLGKPAEAMTGFQRLLELAPDHLDAQRRLRALRMGERPEGPRKQEPAKKPEFTPIVLDEKTRHPLLTARMRAMYWVAGFVLLALVVVNIVLRLDIEF